MLKDLQKVVVALAIWLYQLEVFSSSSWKGKFYVLRVQS